MEKAIRVCCAFTGRFYTLLLVVFTSGLPMVDDGFSLFFCDGSSLSEG